MSRTALVTGGNRGLGFEICRQICRRGLQVVLTARRMEDALAAAARLREEGLTVHPWELDVTVPEAAPVLARQLAAEGVHANVLVNNAGIFRDGAILDVDLQLVRESFEVHLFGPLSLIRAFAPGMRERGYGRIVNVCSGYGQISQGLKGSAASYNLSKAALGAMTLRLSVELPATVKVNAALPGWLSNRGGPVSMEAGADTVVWLTTLPDDGPSGGLFRERRPAAW